MRLAVPYNIADFKGRLVGLDAYFWGSVEVDARLVLLLRPADLLAREAPLSARILGPRVDIARQLRDLESLRGGLARWAVRHARWKLKRLIYPAREPVGGWEHVYASTIVRGLDPGSARPVGSAWLLVEFDLEGRRAVLGGSEDRMYTWLLRSDKVFRSAVAEALKSRGL